MTSSTAPNYYELLQLSPNAEQLVITKIYRLLAAYYHPDNKQTGDEEKFKSVLKAYEVLSDPTKRSRYNIEFLGKEVASSAQPRPEGPAAAAARSRDELRTKYGANADSALGEEGLSERELRKLMLMVLYDVRRNTPGNPQVSMLVLAELLGCSIANLEFSNWYLKEKGYIRISESADFSITIAGVDYVETELVKTEGGKQVLSLPEGRR
jgi:curved DNA-binding protein CbpA